MPPLTEYARLRALRVTRDEPGRILALEGEGFQVPRVAVGCLAAFLLPFAIPALWSLAIGLCTAIRTSGFESLIALVTGLFWLAVPVIVVVALRSKAWMPVAFRVDGPAGELVVVEQHAVSGRQRREVLPLAQIAGATVETGTRQKKSRAVAATALGSLSPPNVRVTVRVDDGSRTPHERLFLLHVDGVDRREEVADFAFRFAAAASLPYQRVVRSDPRDIELALSAAMGMGHEKIPALEGPASYSTDVVSKGAVEAAAEERVPLFDPTTFPSEHKAEKWWPGREVVFRKPMGGAMGCLPVAVAGFLAGPAVFVLSTMREPPAPLTDRLVGAAFFGFVGLVVCLVASLLVVSALPRRVTVDWSARTITVAELLTRTDFAFADVTGLEMLCVRKYHTGGKNSSSYHTYRCDLRAHLRPGPAGGTAKPLVLVGTRPFREDPDTPYRGTLPLATELAEAMGVGRRVTDFPV